jgi:hypothetical protein
MAVSLFLAMELTQAQYEGIKSALPVQRGNVRLSNLHFEKLQVEQIVRIKLEAVCLDPTSIKVHPDGTGALEKTDPKLSAKAAADGTPRFIWLPRMLERP